MKKVATITYHASHNCGSMLQALALQKVILENCGYENELINFSNQGQKEMYAIFNKVRTPRNLAGNLLRLAFYPLLIRSRNDFEAFITDYLKVADERYTETEELKVIDGKYQYYVCGSDQVWNTKAKDFDDAYFLSFVTKGRKIAYATSLGATNIIEKEEDRRHYEELLSDFSHVSVREGNGKSIIKNIYRDEVKITVDPTLLLSKEEWNRCVPTDEPLVKGKYIFYYAFGYNDNVNRFVREMGKKYKMPVYLIDAKPWGVGRKFRFGFKLSKKFGPIAMLNLMRHASLVFTTSFHGNVFSTIYEKKFWFVKSDMFNKNDDRATYLLNQLGLIDRFKSIAELKHMNLMEEIDFVASRNKIETLKEDSINFLKESLA